MNDTYTRMLAMPVGIEVKPATGDEKEAQVQLALWMSAGLMSRRALALAATGDAMSLHHLPMLGWTVIGHRWELFIGYVADNLAETIVRSPLF